MQKVETVKKHGAQFSSQQCVPLGYKTCHKALLPCSIDKAHKYTTYKADNKLFLSSENISRVQELIGGFLIRICVSHLVNNDVIVLNERNLGIMS